MLLERVTAFGSGVLAAGAAVVGAALVLGTVAVPSGDAVAGGDDNVVCVGPDSVLRVPPEGREDCPAGTRRLELAGPDHEAKNLGCSGCDPWQDTPTRGGATNPKLAELERRLEKLEQTSLFVVVDKEGRKVLSVGPGLMALYNRQGVAVDTMRATEDGGDLMSRSADNGLWVTIGARGAVAGLRIFEGGSLRINLGTQPAGNNSLKFADRDKLVAGIGESQAGTGVVLVSDTGGTVRASLQIAGGKGSAGIFGRDGTAILTLTEGSTGGGLLVLGDRTGEPMVKMGVNKGSYGAVLTGPRAGFPYVPRSGLPGSYFFGCAPGPACKQ